MSDARTFDIANEDRSEVFQTFGELM